jgi:hypothetical protein
MYISLVRRLHFANARFAFFFITLVAGGLMADRRPAT